MHLSKSVANAKTDLFIYLFFYLFIYFFDNARLLNKTTLTKTRK